MAHNELPHFQQNLQPNSFPNFSKSLHEQKLLSNENLNILNESLSTDISTENAFVNSEKLFLSKKPFKLQKIPNSLKNRSTTKASFYLTVKRLATKPVILSVTENSVSVSWQNLDLNKEYVILYKKLSRYADDLVIRDFNVLNTVSIVKKVCKNYTIEKALEVKKLNIREQSSAKKQNLFSEAKELLIAMKQYILQKVSRVYPSGSIKQFTSIKALASNSIQPKHRFSFTDPKTKGLMNNSNTFSNKATLGVTTFTINTKKNFPTLLPEKTQTSKLQKSSSILNDIPSHSHQIVHAPPLHQYLYDNSHIVLAVTSQLSHKPTISLTPLSTPINPSVCTSLPRFTLKCFKTDVRHYMRQTTANDLDANSKYEFCIAIKVNYPSNFYIVINCLNVTTKTNQQYFTVGIR